MRNFSKEEFYRVIDYSEKELKEAYITNIYNHLVDGGSAVISVIRDKRYTKREICKIAEGVVLM